MDDLVVIDCRDEAVVRQQKPDSTQKQSQVDTLASVDGRWRHWQAECGSRDLENKPKGDFWIFQTAQTRKASDLWSLKFSIIWVSGRWLYSSDSYRKQRCQIGSYIRRIDWVTTREPILERLTVESLSFIWIWWTSSQCMRRRAFRFGGTSRRWIHFRLLSTRSSTIMHLFRSN